MFPHELEAAFAVCPAVYFPYGLCEPHGPHCALGLDGLKAHGLPVRTARRHGGLVAPALETTASWSPAASVSLTANATWQQVEDLTTHARLGHRPKWVGGARATWRPAPRFELQLDSQAVSGSFDEQIPVPDRNTVAGYGVVELAGIWRLAGPWVRRRIDNLTGKQYQTLIGFPGTSRSFRLGLRYAGR